MKLGKSQIFRPKTQHSKLGKSQIFRLKIYNRAIVENRRFSILPHRENCGKSQIFPFAPGARRRGLASSAISRYARNLQPCHIGKITDFPAKTQHSKLGKSQIFRIPTVLRRGLASSAISRYARSSNPLRPVLRRNLGMFRRARIAAAPLASSLRRFCTSR